MGALLELLKADSKPRRGSREGRRAGLEALTAAGSHRPSQRGHSAARQPLRPRGHRPQRCHCQPQAPGAGGSARAAGTLREPAPFPERPLRARRRSPGTRPCSPGAPTEGVRRPSCAGKGPEHPLAPAGCLRGPGPAPARPAPHSPRAAAAAVTSASIPRRTAEVTSRRRERFRPV